MYNDNQDEVQSAFHWGGDGNVTFGASKRVCRLGYLIDQASMVLDYFRLP